MESVDPGTLLFSISTLAGDVPPLEPIEAAPGPSAFLMHEDDWAQLEFFPAERLEELQRVLSAYKPFEAQHRREHGWAEVFVRQIERVPVLAEPGARSELEALLGATLGAAPVLFWSGGVTGRVAEGFSMDLGDDVMLYGHTNAGLVPVLGAHLGTEPDHRTLVQAFVRLHARYGLVLVDWQAPMILTGVAESGDITVWQP